MTSSCIRLVWQPIQHKDRQRAESGETDSLVAANRQGGPTNAYGRYHHLRNVARQPIDAPRSLNSCSVTRRDAGTLMRRDRVVGRHGW